MGMGGPGVIFGLALFGFRCVFFVVGCEAVCGIAVVLSCGLDWLGNLLDFRAER